MRRLSTCLAALVVLPLTQIVATATAPAANAFCTEVALVQYCTKSGHNAITRKALGFLSPALLSRVIDKNVDQDSGNTGDDPVLHFSNCLFSSSTYYIRDQYRQLLNAVAPDFTLRPDTSTATLRWGQLLHTVQDFYSHSSWVDPEPIGLGFGTTHPRYLLDAGENNWRQLKPYEPVFRGGSYDDILPTEGRYTDGILGLPMDSHGHPTSVVPRIVDFSRHATPTGTSTLVTPDLFKEYRGLMTAVSRPLDPQHQQCPPANGTDCLRNTDTCIRHGGGECYQLDHFPPIWLNCFNHDRPIRDYHNVAFDTAVAQTRHEWCRVLNMLRDQSGFRAASVPITLWTKPSASIHPPGTSCAEESPPGHASVTVHFSGAWRRSANRVVSSFAAYSSDFRQSFRQVTSGDVLVRGKGQICIDPQHPHAIVATMWGFEVNDLSGRKFMAPNDPVRIGVTVISNGPDTPTATVDGASEDLQFAVRVTRDAVPAAECL
jgi:hypothetical protein